MAVTCHRLAAISVPPVAAEANRHAPSRPHPGRLAAAANAAPIAVARTGPPGRGRDRLPAQIHCHRRGRHPPAPRCGPGTGGPSRGRSYTVLPPAPPPGGPRTPPATTSPGHRADGLGHIQPPGQRERRQQRMAHPAPGAPQPGHEDLPVPARLPDIRRYPARTSAARHTTGGRGAGTPDHGRPPRTHRPPAGPAIRWPRVTPPRIPSRGRRNTGVPDPEDVPPAVAATGTTPACCLGRRHVAFVA